MLICKFAAVCQALVALDLSDRLRSDSKDPKELEDKILSIAPILPGQGKPDARNPTSKHHHQQQSQQQSQPTNQAQPPAQASTKQPAGEAHPPSRTAPPQEAQAKTNPTDNLIDLESKPSTTAPAQPVPQQNPTPGNPIIPPSNAQVAPVHEATTINAPVGNARKTANLMDDDQDVSHMNDQMSNLKMHEAMVPQGQAPLKRADTESSEVDVFVDAAEG